MAIGHVRKTIDAALGDAVQHTTVDGQGTLINTCRWCGTILNPDARSHCSSIGQI